jgi:hypothetical protein
MASINPTVPFVSVPQTGQFGGLLLQLVEKQINPNSKATAKRGNNFGLIESPLEY